MEYQLSMYVRDVNLFDRNINTRNNTETLLHTKKNISPET
jgi:hypothetical protein